MPIRGKVLGADETQTGLLKIIDTESQFSKAQLVSGAAAAGNVVRRLSSAEAAKTPATRGPGLP